MSDNQAQTPVYGAPNPTDRLDSWKEIAAYLNRGVRTVVRWEQEEGLPVHRIQHDKRGSVYAYKSELAAWQLRRSPEELEETAGREAKGGSRIWILTVAVVAATALALLVGLFAIRDPGSERPRVSPLTTYAGTESAPAISPDGKFVAFSWDGPREDNLDIYVKLIGSGTPLRLTTDPANENSPAWSPDGKHIAFVRLMPNLRFGVFAISILGKEERRLAEVRRIASNFPLRISWSPDGKWIVIPSVFNDYQSAIFLISTETGELRRLTTPPSHYQDVSGVISPDGGALAFLRSPGANNWRVHVAPLDGQYRLAGNEQIIGAERYSMIVPIWTADSREILYPSELDGILTMWRAPVDARQAPRRVSDGWTVRWSEATMSAAGDRFVLGDDSYDLDIWRFDLPGKEPPKRLIASTAGDINPQYSPDGRRVAFSSRRTGLFQIWVADADGTNERQLTSLDSILTGMPRWSPDGTKIAFDARAGGEEAIWVIESEGGSPQRITSPPVYALNPSWSRDGRWIYFTSRRTGRAEMWRIEYRPSGPKARLEKVTRNGGWNGFESTDGRSFYYASDFQMGPIYRIPAAGGEPVRVVSRMNVEHNLAVVKGGLYYAVSEEPHLKQSVWYYDFSTGESRLVVNTGRAMGLGLDVSPDRRWLLCTLLERRRGDLWLIEVPR